MPAENYDIRDDRFAKLIHMNAGMDTLWTGGRWAEGPAYLAAGRYLIWSDIPNDRIMRWDEMNGEVAVFEQHVLAADEPGSHRRPGAVDEGEEDVADQQQRQHDAQGAQHQLPAPQVHDLCPRERAVGDQDLHRYTALR